MIKHKKSSNILYYPSIESMKLKEISSFKWNTGKSLIDRFKEYLYDQRYDSPIFDNLNIKCFPKGFQGYLKSQNLAVMIQFHCYF